MDSVGSILRDGAAAGKPKEPEGLEGGRMARGGGGQNSGWEGIGAAGFEPATSRSQTLRSTRLSHAPDHPEPRQRKTSDRSEVPFSSGGVDGTRTRNTQIDSLVL